MSWPRIFSLEQLRNHYLPSTNAEDLVRRLPGHPNVASLCICKITVENCTMRVGIYHADRYALIELQQKVLAIMYFIFAFFNLKLYKMFNFSVQLIFP